MAGFHLENVQVGGGGGGGGATGRIWILREGGMIVKNMTKFHKRHLAGRCMLKCVCKGSYRVLSFEWGGTPKFGVDVWR